MATPENVTKIETEFSKALRILKLNIDEHLEFAKIKAQIKKAQYDAYVDNGFSPEQALELCKGDI